MKRSGVISLIVLATLGVFHAPGAEAKPRQVADQAGGESLHWSEQKVTAGDGGLLGQFGYSVAISGDTALIGARTAGVDGSLNQGAVHVFKRVDGIWTRTQKLVASDGAANGGFGASVAIHGTHAIVGVYQSVTPPVSIPNAAYIFSESNGVWTETAKLTALGGPADDLFGYSVAISENTALVGAWQATLDPDKPNQGAAYVFRKSGGVWTLAQTLSASNGKAYEQFGISVALSGDVAIVGANYFTLNRDHPNQGAAYVFRDSGDQWLQTQMLVDPDGAASDFFGTSVAMHERTALIGSTSGSMHVMNGIGAAHVFTDTGSTWTAGQRLTLPDGDQTSFFATSLALSGSTAVVGAMDSHIDGDYQRGSAYIFSKSGGRWALKQRVIASDGVRYDHIAKAVAIDGDTALVGANLNGDDGAAYFYSPDTTAAADISPAALNFALMPGDTAAAVLRIANGGGGDLAYAIGESAGGATAIALDTKATMPSRSEAPGAHAVAGGAIGMSDFTGPRDSRPWPMKGSGGDLALMYDDAAYENSMTLQDGEHEKAGIWLNRFTPPLGTGAFTIESISIMWPQNRYGSLLGREVNLVAYYDADADNYPYNAVRLGDDHVVTIDSLDAFIDYTVNFPVPGDGDVYVGFESVYAREGVASKQYPGGLDERPWDELPLSQRGHSWLIGSTSRDTNIDDLGDNDYMGTLENFGKSGHWMIRAMGTDVSNDCVTPSDVSWLSLTPISGSVPSGSTREIAVQIDTAGLAPGDYSALLCIGTNDPVARLVRVPVRLNVNLDGTIFKDGFESKP